MRTERILLIGDVPIMASLAAMLDGLGYQIRRAPEDNGDDSYAVVVTSSAAELERCQARHPSASFVLVQERQAPVDAAATGVFAVLRAPLERAEVRSVFENATELYWRRVRTTRSSRILLVEDDRDHAELVSMMLSRSELDCQIVAVETLEQAFNRLDNGDFSVALLDLGLPDARGLDGILQIRASRPDVPVVVISGVSDAAFAEQVVRAGAQDFLLKGSFNQKELVDRVRYAVERSSAEAKLMFTATRDPLTGLLNRRAFHQRVVRTLRRASREGRRLAICFIDLDRFKPINDQLGHLAGDRVLAEIARRLESSVRDFEPVCRFGGDEFALLVEAIDDSSDVARIADRLLAALAEPMVLGEQTVAVSGSVGVAVFPDNGETASELLRAADAAMFQAKRRGPGHFQFYSQELHQTAVRRRRIEQELRGALETEAFSVDYQPQFDLATGDVTAVEALLRWRSPSFGAISPAEFLPLLVESGEVGEVWAWALRQACEARSALGSGARARLSINAVASDLQDPGFARRVLKVLDETGCQPGWLELEVTEPALAGDTAAGNLATLAGAGVHLSLDDFGSGASSITRLLEIPLSTIKIDPLFVQAIGDRGRGDGVVGAIVELGHSLGLEVIAEGVERPEELAHLREIGCDRAQGFLLARPMTSFRAAAGLGAAPVVRA